MSPVLDLLSLGCFSDFQVEMLKRTVELRAWVPGHRSRLQIDRRLRIVNTSVLSKAWGLEEITKKSVDGERKRSDSEF